MQGAEKFIILSLFMAGILTAGSGCSKEVDTDPGMVAKKFVITCLGDMHKTRWKLLDKSSRSRLQALAEKAPPELRLHPRDFLTVKPTASEYWAGSLHSKVLESTEKRAVVEVTSAIGKRKARIILAREGASWKVVLHTPGIVK